MKIEKILTNKKQRQAVVINNSHTVVLNTDGSYSVISNVSMGKAPKADFDEKPFIDAFNEWWEEKRTNETVKRIEEERVKEEERQNLIDKIMSCNSPDEFEDMFELKTSYICKHWSDMYAGRDKFAILIDNKHDYDIIKLMHELHNVEGTFIETRHRAGEDFRMLSCEIHNIEFYGNVVESHFNNSNKHVYKSKESELEFTLERIKESDDLDEIRTIIEEYDDIEDGYYDNNGGVLIVADADLSSVDFTGYSEDVYTYKFAYLLPFKYKWNETEDVDN